MCGIIGIFNSADAANACQKGLEVMKERGRDGYGMITGSMIFSKKPALFRKDLEALKQLNESNNEKDNESNAERVSELNTDKDTNCLAHCLHSMVNFVPEPIVGKRGVLAANCEIYNWQQLCKKYGFRAENDAEMILKLLDMKSSAGTEENPSQKTLGSFHGSIQNILKELDGVYAFAYWCIGNEGVPFCSGTNEVILARDILGIKPMWYSLSRGFAFASEKKDLAALGYKDIQELNPREVIIYNVKDNIASFETRPFFQIPQESRRKHSDIINDVQDLLVESVRKRLPHDPKERMGILFSGGVDSTTIAMICKMLGREFTCYTAVLDEPHMTAEDLVFAEKAAAEYGFELKVQRIKLEDVEPIIKKVAPLIEDTNVVKIGVALTFYAACELARQDGIKVIFSGLGSEEIFAGYERHKNAVDINKECLSGLLKLYERDTYRDDVVTMNNNIELRLPYLDQKLVEYALGIPHLLKINGEQNKIVLRHVAKDLGIKPEFADRKKRAAQYGSRFDKAIERLARRERKLKSEFLKKYYTPPNLKLGVLFSSGKDSAYAMHLMQRQNYEISCLITLRSENPASYMFHTPNIWMVELQAEAMGLPLVQQITKGNKEEELDDLEAALEVAVKRHKIEGVVTGALFSEYQRSRIEKVCDRLGLKIFSPLWHMDQELELRQIVGAGFEVVLSSIASFGLDQSWLGRKIDQNFVNNLKTIHNMYKINIAGEGGEYESLVLDGPMFKKKIVIEESEIEVEKTNTARMVVEKARLVDKAIVLETQGEKNQK
jgi:diphthine-ammonia ligase